MAPERRYLEQRKIKKQNPARLLNQAGFRRKEKKG